MSEFKVDSYNSFALSHIYLRSSGLFWINSLKTDNDLHAEWILKKKCEVLLCGNELKKPYI